MFGWGEARGDGIGKAVDEYLLTGPADKKNKEQHPNEATLIFDCTIKGGVMYVSMIAILDAVGYCRTWSASIVLVSHPLPLLVTRGFRERALFALTFFRIFLFLC